MIFISIDVFADIDKVNLKLEFEKGQIIKYNVDMNITLKLDFIGEIPTEMSMKVETITLDVDENNLATQKTVIKDVKATTEKDNKEIKLPFPDEIKNVSITYVINQYGKVLKIKEIEGLDKIGKTLDVENLVSNTLNTVFPGYELKEDEFWKTEKTIPFNSGGFTFNVTVKSKYTYVGDVRFRGEKCAKIVHQGDLTINTDDSYVKGDGTIQSILYYSYENKNIVYNDGSQTINFIIEKNNKEIKLKSSQKVIIKARFK